ncbi:MAG: DNA mismatch repair protein MutS [Pirellulaceae bacterium]|nr:DNA mismatch repair protein MutS [Pirellulaceae bacterium]
MTVPPMQRQYDQAKAACGDAILLFRVGDFYELFNEDAITCGRVLGMTVTSRDKGENPTPMAGFPHHQLESYLGKLIRLGFRVAVCDQVEDAREAKGVVRREITRIVTAGTLTDEALLDPLHTNWLVAIYSTQPGTADPQAPVGLAWTELSTGRFEAGVFARSQLLDELARLEPSEVLLREDDTALSPGNEYGWTVTLRPTWQFNSDEAHRQLCQHFGTQTLEGMGWDSQRDGPAIGAAGAVLAYLQETQRTSLVHLRNLLPSHALHTLEIDAATRRSLEITQTLRDGKRAGSLLGVLDQTCTAMGARLLAGWIANPLVDLSAIQSRHAAVQELVNQTKLRGTLRQTLSGIFDLQRLLGRLATGRANPRDLLQVGMTLQQLPAIEQRLTDCNSQRLYDLRSNLELCESLCQRLLSTLRQDCPLHTRDGGFIQPGCNDQLDELWQLARGGKQWIAQYQAQQIEQTGITSLKVGYTKVFGYYLEVTNTHQDKVPDYFMRKQTLKNAERYITDELKQYESKVLTADEQALALEQEIFGELRAYAAEFLPQLLQSAQVLAEVDVLAGLAELAVQRDYVRPEMDDSCELEISEGRHPVLDATMPQGTFVPNDVSLGPTHRPLALITGPNMAGKSTYIRQVALLAVMAQLGSFVPARRARMGVVDRIFARVGASDELSRGQSTFMVEMLETARILNTATARSLIILDEIGRGTSTYDGLSLAWAIVEFLHDKIGARTLFATHYHELTQLEKSLPGVQNLNVAVKEWDEHIVFLHRIVPGGADRSYGIHVARLAGIPAAVNARAQDILRQLETDHVNHRGDSKITPPQRKPNAPVQLTLFEFGTHPVIEKLRQLDIQATTPLEALRLLHEWQKEAES